MSYRVVLMLGDVELASVPCSHDRGNTGRFACSVTSDASTTDQQAGVPAADHPDDDHAPADGPADVGAADVGAADRAGLMVVEWAGGPTGPGLDYVVERRLGRRADGFRFEPVTSVTDRLVRDQLAEPAIAQLPTYRVTARFDGVEAISIECSLEAAIVVPVVPGIGAEFVCPAPTATFVDTFGADRDGGARQHRGVDMFAAVGDPVVAPEDGELVLFWNDLGGASFGLYGDSGAFYYGAHLDSFVGEDRRVVAGELVGTIGNTGNARTTPPHLHFQIHPEGRGTPAVNPTAATQRACP